ncbi:MAG: hypothetical protein RI924_14 [Bacteroidota bacterium]|jgi:hypothetical protein
MKTKNILIASFALLLLALISRFLLVNTAYAPKPVAKKAAGPKWDEAYIASLHFADESLPVTDNYVLNKVKRVFNTYGYDNLRSYRLHRVASTWFPIMEPILADYGIPNDFKYVPLVESGLHSGVSHKGAAGVWQFMPHTARQYGLKVNGGVDERLQIKKSTIAACKYIRSLHKEFKNWTLVAAAFNIGENKLKRLIRQQEQDDYFSIRFNPETSIYVYKLIAVKEIIEHPNLHGYDKAPIPSYAINLPDTRFYTNNLLRGIIHTSP